MKIQVNTVCSGILDIENGIAYNKQQIKKRKRQTWLIICGHEEKKHDKEFKNLHIYIFYFYFILPLHHRRLVVVGQSLPIPHISCEVSGTLA